MLHRAIAVTLALTGLLAACQSVPAEKPVASVMPKPAATQKTADTVAAHPATATVYPYTVAPVDQTPQEPALQAFVQKVLRACAARRQADLLTLVDDSVAVSAGGGIYGKPGFISDFLNESRPGSGFARLQEVIRLGGTVAHDSAGHIIATFPYLQDGALYKGKLATVELDPFITLVGTVPKVVVYQRPTLSSKPVAQLDYPVLFTGYDAPELGGDWLRVVAIDSSFQGFAQAKNLYCLAAMTLTIEQKKGRFRITSVISFD